MLRIGGTVSYGLIVLFITFGIPYSAFSLLLQNAEPQSIASAARVEFVNGYRIAILLSAAIDAVAILPSAMRGPREGDLGGHRRSGVETADTVTRLD